MAWRISKYIEETGTTVVAPTEYNTIGAAFDAAMDNAIGEMKGVFSADSSVRGQKIKALRKPGAGVRVTLRDKEGQDIVWTITPI